MDRQNILNGISRGRTDFVFDLLDLPDWQAAVDEGRTKPLQWLVYYNDVTALKAVLAAGGDLASIDLDEELAHAAFFGHWKVCDFLIGQGADVNAADTTTGETPLHAAVSKAARPYYLYVVRLLVEHGANVNAATIAGQDTGAFMRDVRTKGETPLHRAAAYCDSAIVRCLLDQGADPTVRDANGDSPLTWASEHQRPGEILSLLTFGDYQISEQYCNLIISDHGAGWGNGMEWKLVGEYLPEDELRQ